MPQKRIHTECTGCNKIVSKGGIRFCSVYYDPSIHWRHIDKGIKVSAIGNGCPFHPKSNFSTAGTGKKRVGQQKQRKR